MPLRLRDALQILRHGAGEPACRASRTCNASTLTSTSFTGLMPSSPAQRSGRQISPCWTPGVCATLLTLVLSWLFSACPQHGSMICESSAELTLPLPTSTSDAKLSMTDCPSISWSQEIHTSQPTSHEGDLTCQLEIQHAMSMLRLLLSLRRSHSGHNSPIAALGPLRAALGPLRAALLQREVGMGFPLPKPGGSSRLYTFA